jgi:hypothetical protein
MTNWLRALFEVFRFLKRRRERLNAQTRQERAERAEERQHQLDLLESLFSKIVTMAQEQQKGLLEVAKAQQAQAAVLTKWLEGFQNTPEPEEPTIAPSLRDEDDPMEDLTAALGDVDPSELPPEFRLAFAEHQKSRLGEVSSGDSEDSSY